MVAIRSADAPAGSSRPASRLVPWLAKGKRAAQLLAAWMLLNLMFNLRYPGPGRLVGALLPSIDATVLLAVCALWARRRERMPAVMAGALGAVVVLIRVFRVGDGVTRRYFNRPLSLALDLPLFGEVVRLLNSTVSRPWLIGGIVLCSAVLALIGVLAAWALRRAQGGFAVPGARAIFAGMLGVALAVSPFLPADGGRGARFGAFGASVMPEAWRQTRDWLALDRRRAAVADEIRAVDQRLRRNPHGLEKLRGAGVFLFLIESYGATVIDTPAYARQMGPVYEAAATALGKAGFDVVSGLLSSPTYAGRSWLAQESLATGVRAPDHLVDVLIQKERPTTMARFFREAGYRTVLVQPGSTHRSLPRWMYDFEQVYSAWDLAYRGPGFLWAPMPDQYVIDFGHRRETVQARGPVLIEYALVSSHAPWSAQPSIVDDWGQIGDGRIFGERPITRFPITWTNLSDGADAYLHAVAYDLEVLTRYIVRFVPTESLVVVLGDHQPVAEVTGWSDSFAVPVHVISRNRTFIDAFRARGYASGMTPRRAGTPAGLETFLPDLLADFSSR